MIHVVRWAHKSAFIRDIKNPKIQLEKDGEVVDEKDFKLGHVPGAGRSYIPKTVKGKKQINLSQAELNKLVKQMNLYDEHNDQITEAPINNPSADFWKHPRIRLSIDYSGTQLNDEDPFGKFWLACLEADREFNVGGERNPAMSAITKFDVRKIEDVIDESEQELDDIDKATNAIHDMSFEKQVKVLRAMGVRIDSPEPNVVRRNLIRKVTIQKDQLNQGRKNLELFLELIEDQGLDIKSLVKAARDQDVIVKHKSRGYMFGAIELGTTLPKVYSFLSDEANSEVLESLDKQTKQ